MSVPTAEKLEWYYALKTLSADGQPCPQLACQAGTDKENLINAALTQGDDYWNGAIGRFDSATPTVLLRGLYFHVKDFVATLDKLILARPLPATPASGGTPDTLRLFFGGNFRSNEQVPGMKAAGVANITGIAILRAGYRNGEGDGTLSFNVTLHELAWKAPTDANPGPSVGVAVDGTYTVFSEDEDKFLIVSVTAAALPVGNQSDTITLTQPLREVLPDWEGYETSGAGKTRYHLVVAKNTSGDDMVDARVFVAPDTTGPPTTMVDAIGTGAVGGVLSNASNWPVRSFWAYNSNKDDVRYVKYRSGNTLYFAAAGTGLRDKVAVPWDVGDAVTVYPEIDIGIDAPSANQFENPTNETTPPVGVTFSAPVLYDTAMALGTLAAGSIYGIWIRETIVQGQRAREDFSNLISVEWR